MLKQVRFHKNYRKIVVRFVKFIVCQVVRPDSMGHELAEGEVEQCLRPEYRGYVRQDFFYI